MSKGNNFARHQFERLGLTYKNISSREFFSLVEILSEELKKHTGLEMTISKKRKLDRPQFKFDKKGLMNCGFIKVSSSYFEGREAISFNQDGFIGFAGWSDSTNTKPILKAFYRWIRRIRDEIKS